MLNKTAKAAGWNWIDEGEYGDEAIKFGGDWYALMTDYQESNVIGRPLKCLQYYRVDFNKRGAFESRLIVATDRTAKSN